MFPADAIFRNWLAFVTRQADGLGFIVFFAFLHQGIAAKIVIAMDKLMRQCDEWGPRSVWGLFVFWIPLNCARRAFARRAAFGVAHRIGDAAFVVDAPTLAQNALLLRIGRQDLDGERHALRRKRNIIGFFRNARQQGRADGFARN